MGQIKWYKRYPKDALNGFMGLSLEERGAYCTVLELIYERDGNLPDDDRFIAGWMMADVRVWKRIKARLIDLGKLEIRDGKIHNPKADVEVDAALSRVGSARDAGLASAASKARKSADAKRKNKDLGSTVVPTPVATPVSTNQNQNHKLEEPDGSSRAQSKSEPPAKRKPRTETKDGTLLPAEFEPRLGPKTREFVDRWPDGMFDRELRKFRNHALDKGRRSKDWNAALRTWLENADEWMKRDGRQHTGSASGGYGADRRDGFERALDEELGLGPG